MFTSIASFLSGALNAVSGFFKLKASPNVQRREAEKDVAAKDAEIRSKTDQIKQAVYSGDDVNLNKIVIDLMKPALAVILAFGAGCASNQPEIVYIPTDRKIESCTNSLGISCKAVPDAVMVEMLEKIQELNSIKTEMKVDKRVTK